MPSANGGKVRLVNNRLYMPVGAFIKRKGDDGEVVHVATEARPIWIGQDNDGLFVAYGKQPTETVRGYYDEDGSFVVIGPAS